MRCDVICSGLCVDVRWAGVGSTFLIVFLMQWGEGVRATLGRKGE